MMGSNNSDTARYSYKNISPVSLKMAVIPNESEVKIFLTLCKGLKTFINQTNVAETFINP